MADNATVRRAILLALFVLVLCVPLLGEAFYTRLATRILIFGLIALSLDLILGYGGMISFGHAAFVGLGAYATAILTFHGVGSAFVVWPAAIVVAAAGALVIGAISLRTGGVYFIMITLAFAQMLYYAANGIEEYGAGEGLRMPARNSFLGAVDMADPVQFFYLTAALFIVVFFVATRLVASRFGQVLLGIKTNERRMRALGFETYRYKLTAFAIAGALAGLGGALDANLNAYVSPAMLHWVLSGDLLVMLILGGVGTLAGPVLGAGAFLILEEALSGVTRHWMAIFGPLMLLVILFHRGGIYALLPKRRSTRLP